MVREERIQLIEECCDDINELIEDTHFEEWQKGVLKTYIGVFLDTLKNLQGKEGEN